MNRLSLILLAALDALITAAIGLGAALVPATIVWGVQFGLAPDWGIFWRAGADVWLLGHGVPLHVALDASASAVFGQTAATSFTVGIAALGFALITIGFGIRTGRRVAGTPYPVLAAAVAVGVFAAAATLVTLTAQVGPVRPSLWRGILFPAVVITIGVCIGWGIEAARGPAAGPQLSRILRLTPGQRLIAVEALRAGVMGAFAFLAGSALVLTVMIALRYATLISLYESVQAGALGAVIITLAQFALLPNAVVWTSSWLAGPGFVLGTGSSVSPAGTQLGPVPALPLLGTLPHGGSLLGFVGLVVPLAASFAVGMLVRARLARRGALPGASTLTAVALGGAVVQAAIMGCLAWASAGSIGPGRLVQVGPIAWQVALAVLVIAAVGGSAGILARTGRERVPDRGTPVGAAHGSQ